MSFELENFKVSDEMKQLSSDDFKAVMKRQRPSMKVRDIKKVYDFIHGNTIPVSTKVSEDKQPEVS